MPGIKELRNHMQRLAAVTAIFAVEVGEPSFGFGPRWRKHRQVAMCIDGSMMADIIRLPECDPRVLEAAKATRIKHLVQIVERRGTAER